MIGGRMEKAWEKVGTEGEAACCGMWAPLGLAFNASKTSCSPLSLPTAPPKFSSLACETSKTPR